MIALTLFFAAVCVGELWYILRTRRQLARWLAFLKALHESPNQNSFTKGDDLLAGINFELNRILAEGRRQFTKLQKAEHAGRQLLTDLSHDIRTPLASLSGYLEALDRASPGEKEEYIHVARKKAADLQELIDLLFQWFKLSSEEQLLQMKPWDINELTRELFIRHIPVLEREKIHFSVSIPEGESFVQIDRTAYGRILDNLIANAIKHGKCSLLKISIRSAQDRVLVCVSNNGTAIPPKDLPFIFDRMYKSDSSRCGKGSGLGLAIVRKLTEDMSGEITVQSVPGGMTDFSLSFPVL